MGTLNDLYNLLQMVVLFLRSEWFCNAGHGNIVYKFGEKNEVSVSEHDSSSLESKCGLSWGLLLTFLLVE